MQWLEYEDAPRIITSLFLGWAIGHTIFYCYSRCSYAAKEKTASLATTGEVPRHHGEEHDAQVRVHKRSVSPEAGSDSEVNVGTTGRSRLLIMFHDKPWKRDGEEEKGAYRMRWINPRVGMVPAIQEFAKTCGVDYEVIRTRWMQVSNKGALKVGW